ncbi:MAG: hypothetical protein LBU34_05475, partial [Planctomycetaceae bacterium]|nr:hypothetical protein [Planctomycetaceae bacterium]
MMKSLYFSSFFEIFEQNIIFYTLLIALSEEELQECFPLADTIQGDEFVFKPGEKSGIYCLPRDE